MVVYTNLWRVRWHYMPTYMPNRPMTFGPIRKSIHSFSYDKAKSSNPWHPATVVSIPSSWRDSSIILSLPLIEMWVMDNTGHRQSCFPRERCLTLYTVVCDCTVSKKVSMRWSTNFPSHKAPKSSIYNFYRGFWILIGF